MDDALWRYVMFDCILELGNKITMVKCIISTVSSRLQDDILYLIDLDCDNIRYLMGITCD